MRITTIHIENAPPVQRFHVDTLSNMVVIGGANGAGKTRLLQSLIGFFRKPRADQDFYLLLAATTTEEEEEWNKPTLDTRLDDDCAILTRTLRRNRRRAWRSGVINFESDRTVQKIEPLAFSWTFPDPNEEKVSSDATLSGLKNRWQNTLHAIFKQIGARRKRIADDGESLISIGTTTMPLDFPDPLSVSRCIQSASWSKAACSC